MASTSVSVVDRPLKERYWVYRNVVLHRRKGAAAFDDLYWQFRPVTRTRLLRAKKPL
jgi:hypothetical protein